VDDVGIGAEEARRIGVGLSLMECTGRAAATIAAPAMNPNISLSSRWFVSIFRRKPIMTQLKVAETMS
jgi:hypothetical protein